MSEGLAEYRAVSALFGALASPVRAAIVHLLAEETRTVSDLHGVLGLSQPLVSQHLRVLREHGLVTSERTGRSTSYSLADEHVAHVFLDAYTHTQEESHDPDR